MISFLHNLTQRKSSDDAFPEDICKFLAYKDKGDKTQVQVNECQNRGRKETFSCLCPFRRAAGSVDSLIGQIRANVFSEIMGEAQIGTELSESIIQRPLLLSRNI